MMYDIIVFENLRFRPFTRQREASVFEKNAFLVTVFTESVWTVGETGGKDKNRYVWTGAKC